MDYLLLRQVHITCAILSITGFAARGALMLRDSRLLPAAFALALTTVLYIVSVALTRNPLGFLAAL